MLLSPLYAYKKDKNKNKYIIRNFIPVLLMILINNISASSLILFDTACAIYMFVGIILTNSEKINGE